MHTHWRPQKNESTLIYDPSKKCALWWRTLKKVCTLVDGPKKDVHSGRWPSNKVCTRSMAPCPECTFCHEHSRVHTAHSRAQTVPLMDASRKAARKYGPESPYTVKGSAACAGFLPAMMSRNPTRINDQVFCALCIRDCRSCADVQRNEEILWCTLERSPLYSTIESIWCQLHDLIEWKEWLTRIHKLHVQVVLQLHDARRDLLEMPPLLPVNELEDQVRMKMSPGCFSMLVVWRAFKDDRDLPFNLQKETLKCVKLEKIDPYFNPAGF